MKYPVSSCNYIYINANIIMEYINVRLTNALYFLIRAMRHATGSCNYIYINENVITEYIINHLLNAHNF